MASQAAGSSHAPRIQVFATHDADRRTAVDGDFNQPQRRKHEILEGLGLIPETSGTNSHDKALIASAAAVTELRAVRQGASLEVATIVHSPGMVEFFETAWDEWAAMPADMRDISFVHPACVDQGGHSGESEDPDNASKPPPPLVPANACNRDGVQRPGRALFSRACYYGMDRFTPIDSRVKSALQMDMAVVAQSVQWLLAGESPRLAYALVTHPGHHSAAGTFGGYCFINNAAVAVALLLGRSSVGDDASAGACADPAVGQPPATAGRGAGGAGAGSGAAGTPGTSASTVRCFKRVAVVDVDYHAGNGTVAVFYDDPAVFVASLHMDPEYDYPFTCGFADQTGSGAGKGSTMNIPLQPGTTWATGGRAEFGEGYRASLGKAIEAVRSFGAEALVISLGFDTYENDRIQQNGAEMGLVPSDYREMAAMLAGLGLPTVVMQEGGYEVEVVATLAAQFMIGLASGAES